MFTCPVSGVYVISVTVTSDVGSIARGRIVKESTTSLGAFADNDGSVRNVASVTSVLECSHGERVWVRSEFSGVDVINGDYQRTGFSGFLLYAY